MGFAEGYSAGNERQNSRMMLKFLWFEQLERWNWHLLTEMVGWVKKQEFSFGLGFLDGYLCHGRNTWVVELRDEVWLRGSYVMWIHSIELIDLRVRREAGQENLVWEVGASRIFWWERMCVCRGVRWGGMNLSFQAPFRCVGFYAVGGGCIVSH